MSNMEQRLREIAAKQTGTDIESVPAGNAEEIVAYAAKNYAGGGKQEAPSVDNLSGATAIGKTVMKAADAAAVRKAIGAGRHHVSSGWHCFRACSNWRESDWQTAF